jgi:D-apiose dehydrogenase
MALRVALVGAGYFARFHVDAWMRIPGAVLAGICDRDLDKARAAAPAGVNVFDDAARMLDAIDPGLLDIATPPDTHQALVTIGAERGLPIVCQKPLAPSLAEAERLVETAEQAGISFIAHENFRFMPWYREARRLIDGGRLGRLHSIAFRMRPGDGQGPRAYLDRQPYFQQMKRFLVHETAIHFIDTFRYLMGDVTGVFARLRRINPAIAGEDAGYILFDFQGGATGCFDGNRLNDATATNLRLTMGVMWLEGEHGVLRLDTDGRLWWKPHGGSELEHAYEWSRAGFGGDCVHATLAHVAAHLTRGAPVENTGRAYLRNLVLQEAVYRSNDEGRWIATPA